MSHSSQLPAFLAEQHAELLEQWLRVQAGAGRTGDVPAAATRAQSSEFLPLLRDAARAGGV